MGNQVEGDERDDERDARRGELNDLIEAREAGGDEGDQRQGDQHDDAQDGPHEAHDGELQRAAIDLGVLHGGPFTRVPEKQMNWHTLPAPSADARESTNVVRKWNNVTIQPVLIVTRRFP